MKEIVFSILRMSITGSTLFLLFSFLFYTLKKYISTFWQYAMRICCVFFFLVPFTPVYLAVSKMKKGLNLISVSNEFPLHIEVSQGTDIPIYPSVMQKATLILNISIILFCIWLVGLVAFLIWEIYCFKKHKKRILDSSPLENNELKLLVEKCICQKKITRNVSILQSDIIFTPMVMGIRKPKLIFPSQMTVVKETEYIINHEIFHLLHKDVLIKIMCLLIRGIHWFNPLIYLLCSQMDSWSEKFSDECVVQGMDRQEKIKYVMAILEALESSYNENNVFQSSFKNAKINFQERVSYMMKSRSVNKAISFVLSFLVFCSGVVIVYAEEMVLSKAKTNVFMQAGIEKEILFENEMNEDLLMTLHSEKENMDVIIGDTFAVTATLGNYGWDISSGASCKTNSMYLAKGTKVDISAYWKSSDCGIKIGITDGATFYYYEGSGGVFSGSIEVSKAGYYSVQVKNVSSEGIAIAGSYSTD